MPKLSHDLVLIRKEMRLSKQNVFEKCRIPLETIDAIEDGSIFSGKTRNKTYLRSYFRTYAKAIGIGDDDMVQALNEQESAKYAGSLAEKYLSKQSKPASEDISYELETTPATDSENESQKGQEKDSRDAKSESSTVSDKKNTGKVKKSDTKKETSGSKDDSKKSPANQANVLKSGELFSNIPPGSGPYAPKPISNKKKSITPENQEKTLSDIEWEDSSHKKILSTSTSGFASSESYEPDVPSSELPPPPDLNTVDWATKVKEAVYRPQRNRLLWVIMAIVLALALAVFSIYWYWQREEIPVSLVPPTEETIPPEPGDPAALTEDEPEPGETSPVPVTPDQPQESADAIDTPIDEAAAQTPEQITALILEGSGNDDTLYVTAYALHGNLEPIRIYSDVFATTGNASTELRPYWVEHHQAMRFEFIDEIVFQGTLSRLVLIFNGHVIDNFSELYNDGSRISLTREFIMENEELLFTNQRPFAQIPAPRAVEDRPRFSP